MPHVFLCLKARAKCSYSGSKVSLRYYVLAVIVLLFSVLFVIRRKRKKWKKMPHEIEVVLQWKELHKNLVGNEISHYSFNYFYNYATKTLQKDMPPCTVFIYGAIYFIYSLLSKEYFLRIWTMWTDTIDDFVLGCVRNASSLFSDFPGRSRLWLSISYGNSR